LTNHTIAAASTNAKVVKASKGTLMKISASNHTASFKFVKIYDKATAPTVGTDIPKLTYGIPPNWSRDADLGTVAFQNGIAIAITGAAADTDATAVALNDVAVDVYYL
jgi:hypothetical protein